MTTNINNFYSDLKQLAEKHETHLRIELMPIRNDSLPMPTNKCFTVNNTNYEISATFVIDSYEINE